MKKLLKWAGILLALLVLLIVAAGIVLMLMVNKDMIAGRMESLLHRQVTIEGIEVGLFSVVSGIEVNGIRVSNFKPPEQLEALKGKPVSDSDLFAGLKSFNLKVRLLPLLSGKVELRELVLYEPVVNIVRYRNERFNFSDLLEPAKPGEGEPAKENTAPRETAGEPSGPFTADTIPVSISLGKLGVENGTVTYTDRKSNQTFQLYKLTLLAHDAEIDPKNLQAKNSVKIKFESGIKPMDRLKTGAVESFDVGLEAVGWVKPFDEKTRALDPEVSLEAGSPYGTLTGLRIFEAIKSVRSLEQFTGKLTFLKEQVQWKKGSVDAWYKTGTVKISKGRIPTGEYTLDVAGAVETGTKAIDLDVGMELAEKENEVIRASIEKNIAKQISGDVAKYVPPEKITDLVMKRLVNENGKIYLQYKVAGTMKSPRPRLVSPELPPLSELVSQAGGDAAGLAKEAARKEADKAIEQGTQELNEQIKKGLGDLKF